MRCFSILALLLISSSVFAEHVFLKDGRIISGEITNETAKTITVKDANGKSHKLKSANIMRTLFGEFSRKKVYVYKTDGSVIRAYRVNEDAANQFFRMELESASEFAIPKSKIRTISNVNIAKKKDDSVTVGYGYYAPIDKAAKNFRGNLLSVNATYSTPYQFSSFRTIVALSAGYTGLSTEDVAVKDSSLFMVPVLVSVRYPFTLYQKGSEFNQSSQLDVYVSFGIGLNLLFLGNKTQDESARYMQLQPALGASYKMGLLKFFLQQNFNYLDSKPDPFLSVETQLGVGYFF